MRNRSSVLSEHQRHELQVENFIYHIIKKDNDEPDYLDEVVLSNDRQKDFFRKIISETGQGTQYSFINESSDFKTHCRNIITNPRENFVRESRSLADQFLAMHTGGSISDGVLIVARITIPINTVRKSFIALIKLDYTPVMRQHRRASDENVVELEEVLEALSEQKISVQKRALIDIDNQFDWDVLAVERKKTGAVLDTEDAISNYFRNFMGIRLRENDSALTKRIVSSCHDWAKSFSEGFDGKTAADIRHLVISLMDSYEDRQLDYSEIKDSICRHSNNDVRERMSSSFDTYMSDVGLQGISFAPKPKSIPGRSRKGIWETDSGIQVIWEGTRSESELKKEPLNDGSVKITIIANMVEEKE